MEENTVMRSEKVQDDETQIPESEEEMRERNQMRKGSVTSQYTNDPKSIQTCSHGPSLIVLEKALCERSAL
jgi:hypothetical protein